MNTQILIVKDDQNIQDVAVGNLRNRGFTVSECGSDSETVNRALERRFDLIILDWTLSDRERIEICKKIRSSKIHTPLLMLSTKNTEVDRVIGLEMGADVYLSQPFGMAEFEARVKALMRRAKGYSSAPSYSSAPKGSEQESEHVRRITIGCLDLDLERQELRLDGTIVSLTSTEFDLLSLFMRNPGKPYNRQQLLDEVWGLNMVSYDYAVSSQIKRLRRKIEPKASEKFYIKTAWGVGYWFATEGDVNQKEAGMA